MVFDLLELNQMACSIEVFSCIQNVNGVISGLASTPNQDEWESCKSNVEWNDPENISPLWLQDCCISLSPANDNLVIAKDDKAVFMSSKWDQHENLAPKKKYEVSWSGHLAVEEGERITDVLCIPVASQHRSSQGSPDWTCIVVGFSSGYMRIYLENGSLIFSQLLHEDKVIRLKCRTWDPHRYCDNPEHVEELAILYPDALIIIDGFSLYQSLRACRNQLAKAQASAILDHGDPPPLAYKKWRFDGQKSILDIASCGVVTKSLFDQLQTASFVGGYNETIRDSVPAMSQYVTTGTDPFIAVYSATEESSPLISEVASAVASKLTSALLSRISTAGGWLGWGESTPSLTTESNKLLKPKVEMGSKLSARYGLPDYRRLGNSINLAPNGKLAVTTDEFGRILLLDINKGIAVRMWKGHRDAECGWVIVNEGQEHDGLSVQSYRSALFLVIYSSKRGILEIWRTEQGPRVAAFNVGKDCRLLYAGHGILGLGHLYNRSQSPPHHTLNCTLIQSDGTLKTFAVPFHNAMSDKHSDRMRDLHLLKKLTAFLQNIESSNQDDFSQVTDNASKQLQSILIDIKTPQLQRHGLQCTLGTAGIPGSEMLKAVNAVIEKIERQVGTGEEAEVNTGTNNLYKFCRTQKTLLQTHATLMDFLKKCSANVISGSKQNTDILTALAQLLGISKAEAQTIIDVLDDHHNSQTEKLVAHNMMVGSDMTVNLFLGCFEVSPTDHKTQQSSKKREVSLSSSGACDHIGIKKTLPTEMKLKLASFIFKDALLNPCYTELIRIPLRMSGINPLHLMDLLASLWLLDTNKPCNDIQLLLPLHCLVSILIAIGGRQFINECDDEPIESFMSAWWEYVHHTLVQTTSVGYALSLASVCRSVALETSSMPKKIQSKDLETESKVSVVSDWVSISSEIEGWNQLIYQLQDIIAIKTFVNRLPMILGCQQVVINKERTGGHYVGCRELSVISLLDGGVGTLAQVLAQWLALYNVPPDLLGKPENIEAQQDKAHNEKDMKSEDDDSPSEIEGEILHERILEGLGELQSKFAHSLHQDILWTSCALECITQWSYKKEEIQKIQLAVGHIKCIHSPRLKHGVASNLWKNYFQQKISTFLFLVEKVGKAPKDRLCRKALGFGCSSMIEFLKAAKVILGLISQIDIADAEVLIFHDEGIWHTGKSCQKSVIEDALDEPPSDANLVKLNILVVTIIWMIMALDMKSVRPLSLFDTKTKGAFTKDLRAIPPVSPRTDEAILQARNKFLIGAMTMYIKSIAAVDNLADNLQISKNPDWSSVILWVAEQLNVDVDSIRRRFVYELYSAGLDSFGSEILLSVQEKKSIGSELLVIVGRRLAHVIQESKTRNRVNHLASLPPYVSQWIKSQEPYKLDCSTVALHRTNDLLCAAKDLISEDSTDFSLACDLSEVLKSLVLP